jgi:voltage-gated potassium channel
VRLTAFAVPLREDGPMSSDAAIDAAEERAGLRNPGYEIFIGALSVLSIVNLFLVFIIQDPDLDYVLAIMNAPITVIFFIDFLYRLKTAPSKSDYFWRSWGWADLLASLPFQQTKILRLFRLVKVYRLLKDYGTRNIVRSLIKDKAGSALLSLLFIAILVLQFGSLLMLRLESNVEGANITSASDAIWYIIVTMSTVGYGDQFPITNPGRVLGTVIIVVGVGIFGTLTGYLANLFLSPGAKEQAPPTDLEAKLQELRELAARQQSAIDELEGLIDRT